MTSFALIPIPQLFGSRGFHGGSGGGFAGVEPAIAPAFPPAISGGVASSLCLHSL